MYGLSTSQSYSDGTIRTQLEGLSWKVPRALITSGLGQDQLKLT